MAVTWNAIFTTRANAREFFDPVIDRERKRVEALFGGDDSLLGSTYHGQGSGANCLYGARGSVSARTSGGDDIAEGLEATCAPTRAVSNALRTAVSRSAAPLARQEWVASARPEESRKVGNGSRAGAIFTLASA